MSRRRKESDSSPSPEAVRAWGDVVRLGQTIVAEMELDNSNDTLGRWMSHRLAELMKKAESAKSEAERETARKSTSDLIFALWDHRASWPEGWPPRATAALARSSSRYSRREELIGSVWLDSLTELCRLQAREREIWTDLGLLDFDVESERRAAEELIGEAATEEREAIELVIRLWESAERGMRESIGDETESSVARATAGIKQLKELDSERKKLRARILEQVVDSEEAE